MNRLIKSCPVCSNKQIKLKYTSNFDGNTWEDAVPYFLTSRKRTVYSNTMQCKKCYFMFTNPQFNENEYSNIYKNVEAGKALEKISLIRYKKLKSHLLRYKSSGKILDIGCGDGLFLQSLPKSFQFTGIEPGNHFLNNVFVNGNILNANFTEVSKINRQKWTNYFDIITAWDLIEHVPNINDFFEYISLFLKNDGIFFATLPNAESKISKIFGSKWNLILLEHLWYFSPSSLELIAQKHGLKIIQHQHFPYSIDLRTLVLRIFQTYAHRFCFLSKYVSNKIILNIPIGLMLVSLRKL